MEVKQEPEGLFIEEFNIDIEEHSIQGEIIIECRNYEKDNIELSSTAKNEFVSIKKESENYLRIDNLQQTSIEVKSEIEQIIDDTDIKCNSIQLADNKQSKKYSTTIDESMETKRTRESGELSDFYNEVNQDGNYENGSNNNTSINPQKNTITDILNSTTQTLLGTSPENTIDTMSLKQLEEINLRSLLTEWNLASLTKHLISQNVFVDILKIMRRHHIERLLRNFDLGTQILFEHNLEQWRESIGLSLDHYSSRVHSCRNIHNSPSSPPATSSGRHTPDNNTSSNIHLATILNESSRGILLVEYYNKFLRFQEGQRYSLISLIALYFQEKGVKMTLADSHNIEREILERFPSEKLEYYRTSKRGKIYTKYCNMTTSFKAAVSKLSKGKKQGEGFNKNKSRYGSDLEPEQDAESCLQALKFDNLTSEQFDATWKACYQFRLEYIKSNDIANIMKKWPFYRTPSGYRLIDMDFKAAFGGKDGLLKEWDQTFEKIISFLLIDSRIKDKNARQLLEKLKDDNTSITENGRNAALFWAVHGYLVPTNKVVKKDLATGKMTTTKFTIKSSQESVLFLGKNQQEIEDRINQLKKTNVSIQPSIYCIGKDIFSIEDICLIFDDIRFKFRDLLRALDICFKIIYLFNLEFPAESLTFYSFIEIYFYKYKPVSNTNSRVHILCEYLSTDQSIQ